VGSKTPRHLAEYNAKAAAATTKATPVAAEYAGFPTAIALTGDPMVRPTRTSQPKAACQGWGSGRRWVPLIGRGA
jgi:hypothetical protein